MRKENPLDTIKADSSPDATPDDLYALAQRLHHEIPRLRQKRGQITEIDGKRVSEVKLRVIGKSSIEAIEVTCMQDGEELTKEYTLADYYRL